MNSPTHIFKKYLSLIFIGLGLGLSLPFNSFGQLSAFLGPIDLEPIVKENEFYVSVNHTNPFFREKYQSFFRIGNVRSDDKNMHQNLGFAFSPFQNVFVFANNINSGNKSEHELNSWDAGLGFYKLVGEHFMIEGTAALGWET